MIASLFAALSASRLALAQAATPTPIPVTVFAAASLNNVFDAIARRYREQTGRAVRFSFAATSTLARQLEQGAPADIFVAADEQWMDWAVQRKLVDTSTRRAAIGNRLALIAPADSTGSVELAPNFDLLRLLGRNGRIATGDPAHVPVGRYAQSALTRLGVWSIAEPRLVRADNVRAALALVERGEVPLGIVYATDAAVAPKVRVVGLFPEESHSPITYPMAIAVGRDRPTVREFFAFLQSADAGTIYRAAGFLLRTP